MATTVKATKGIPSVPDVPPQLLIEDVYRILEPLTRIINIRQGKFDPLDRWVTQQDLVDAGVTTVTAVESPVVVVPPTSIYDFQLSGDIIGGPEAMATGQPNITMATAINLPNVVCIDGGDAAETYPGATTGPYGVATGGGGGGVPNGGTAGQLLIKQSATDGDAIWDDYGASTANEAYCPGYASYTRVDDDEFTVDLVNAKNLFYIGRRVRFDQAGTFTYGAVNAVDFDVTSANDTHVTLTMEGADTVPTGVFDVCLVSSATAWSPIAGDPFTGGAIRDIATGAIGGTQWWVAVGDDGELHTSTDGGATWTARTPGTVTTEHLYGVCYHQGNSEFYAVGEDSVVIKTTNGSTWTDVTIPWTPAAGDDLVRIVYQENTQNMIMAYYDFSGGHYDFRYTIDDFATSTDKPVGGGSPELAVMEDPNGNTSIWVYVSATNTRYFSSVGDATASNDKTFSPDNATACHITQAAGVQTMGAADNGEISTGTLTANVRDDVTFANAIRAFASSNLHARTVCVGDAGQIGYIDDADLTTIDSWNSVANGFDPLTNILAVEFNESDGVFVAVADNGQICRSSNGSN